MDSDEIESVRRDNASLIENSDVLVNGSVMGPDDLSELFGAMWSRSSVADEIESTGGHDYVSIGWNRAKARWEIEVFDSKREKQLELVNPDC